MFNVEKVAILNQNGFPQELLDLLCDRTYHPWEGGEGKMLRQYTTARLLLEQKALEAGDPEKALEHFERAMVTPNNLGEIYQPLPAKADVNYWIRNALCTLGREKEAMIKYNEAAGEEGDFQGMTVTVFSELTDYKGLALYELGQREKAVRLFDAMKKWASEQKQQPTKIDYFATSLPDFLVFKEDPGKVRPQSMDRPIEQAEAGLSMPQ